MLVKILIYYQLQKNNFNNNRGVKTPFKNKTNMYYIITTQQGDQIKETDYFKAYRYSLFNKCILEQRNGSGVRVEINNFSNL